VKVKFDNVRKYTNAMGELNEPISVTELRRLLIDLRDKRPDICIRFRLLGEMWSKSFFRVIHVSDKSIVLTNDQDGRLCSVSDLQMVIQFEIDSPFHNFKPFFHYQVKAVPVY
jgi:hypothetical protein